MAAVVMLEGTDLPLDVRSWALVRRDRSRGVGVMMDQVIHHGSGATFYVTEPYGEAEQSHAIERAKTWADNHSVPTVYVAAQ
jgi:hypothetical protein